MTTYTMPIMQTEQEMQEAADYLGVEVEYLEALREKEQQIEDNKGL